MAEQEERSTEDLGEEISQRRLEEFRDKGQVAQSRELASLAALLAAGVATYSLAPSMGAQLAELMRELFRTDLSARLDLGKEGVLAGFLMRSLKITANVALPIGLAGFVVGALGSFSQVGSIFSTDPLTPDFSKIDPIKGIQRFFSSKMLIDGLRMLAKLVVAVAVAYSLVKSEVVRAPALLNQELPSLFGAYGHAAWVIFIALSGVFLLFGLIDYFFQRLEFNKQLRLTKPEAKKEHKETEGDPMLKARIRAIARDRIRKNMLKAVKTADFVVTNPTHIAVAMKWDRDKMAAPKVVAKGADFFAQKIKEVAAQNGVPMVENVPLARTLYKTVKVGQFIPRALFQAVAEVLAYVYRLRNRRM